MECGNYYNNDDEDISRASMNTEAWHGRIMGLTRGLQARAASKQDKDTDSPNNESDSEEEGDAEGAVEDPSSTNEAAHPPAPAETGGVQEE
jgi:hypothetical protein